VGQHRFERYFLRPTSYCISFLTLLLPSKEIWMLAFRDYTIFGEFPTKEKQENEQDPRGCIVAGLFRWNGDGRW
jgi:hypothetical protein